jgi:predicted RNase H-related nuclease YkuK (DUF458 family)
MEIKNKFKKFGGEFIPDIIEYLKEFLNKQPGVTISVGCDSIQKKRKTLFAITIMLYNQDIRNGAHVVFFRENIHKIRDNFERLTREVTFAHELAEYLEKELATFYQRLDLTELELKKYKFHLNKCNGEFTNLSTFDELSVTKSLSLTESEKNFKYKLVDIHLDFNPKEGQNDSRGFAKNRSNVAYRSFVPWLRGSGYRVWVKPYSHASSSAADLLVQD